MAGPWEMFAEAPGASAPEREPLPPPEDGVLRVYVTGGQRRDEQPEAAEDEMGPWQAFAESAPTTSRAGTSPQERGLLGELGRQAGLTGRYLVEGLSALPAMVANVPAGLYNEAADLVAGEGNGFRFPDQAQAVSGLLTEAGLPNPEGASERVIGDASRALAGAGGWLAAAQRAAQSADPLIRGLGEMLMQQPMLQGVSAVTGAGAGSATREGGGGPVVELAATLAGGLAPVGVAALPAAASNAIRRGAPADAPELIAAFERQGVTPMADQVGGTGVRAASAGVRSTLGAIPMAEAAEQSIKSAGAARDRIASGMGAVTDELGVGAAAQRGARDFIKRTEDKGSKLYEAIPVKPDRPAALSNTRTALTELTAGLRSNPELSALMADRRLERIRDALSGGRGLSWEDLKQFRTHIGELTGRPSLQSDTSQGALQRLYGALSDDMRATAAEEGPAALKAFERANGFWRARQARIDGVLTSILGSDLRRGGEAAFRQINSWARSGGKGDFLRLAQMMRSMPAEEADTIRASIFARLGEPPPARQADGVTFSPADFGRHWQALDARAKSVLFPGKEYRQDIDDIVRISEAMEGAAEFTNTSRTALATNLTGNLLSGAVLGYLADPTLGLTSLGVPYGAGKLLASPRFAKWLAKAPKKPNSAAIKAHVARLSSIAASEPAIANEVHALQQRLTEAFTAPTGGYRAAASPSSAEDKPENRQTAPDR